MLNWINRFNICSFLDNHQYHSSHHTIECLAAAGAAELFTAKEDILARLSAFIQQQQDWLFGHISYELKDEIEQLQSAHPDHIGFPAVFFFRPETVVQLLSNEVAISTISNDPAEVYREILSCSSEQGHPAGIVHTQPRISKDKYIAIIQQLREHIHRGDCYELNFCQEFYAEHTVIAPLAVYHRLTALSPNPFACFYKLEDKYLLCASPERYLQKKGNTILSQPIKGTAKRDMTNPESDLQLIKQLQHSEKDRRENVMVVDLVRNDLSRVCKEGTVKVEELFGIYSFPQVHQMISTITGELADDVDLSSILKATFPMGSMTGAPKKRVLQLIEQYEQTKRGIYSGAVGYITPSGDFDFNVVIRSMLYNATAQYLSYLVGGGITFYSDPEKEYEECLLKAAAIQQVLRSSGSGASL